MTKPEQYDWIVVVRGAHIGGYRCSQCRHDVAPSDTIVMIGTAPLICVECAIQMVESWQPGLEYYRARVDIDGAVQSEPDR